MTKKNSKPNGRDNRDHAFHERAPMPDPRSIEKMLSELTRQLQDQQFDSTNDINAYLKEMMASEEPISATPRTPLQKAQELMYDAWESSGKKRVRLARKALKISPDCADAYVLLAEEAASSLEEARELYKKGVLAGERAIGPEMFIEGVGHFWGILETRPYMRARAGLAQCLWSMDERDKAIEHLQEMLELNPGDNQGLRYTLSAWLFEAGRNEALLRLLRAYDEASATWTYANALFSFRQDGNTPKTRNLLQEAFESNPYVPDYILGKRVLPSELPAFIGIGDENEAVSYAIDAIQLWAATPGALDWLKANRDEYNIPLPSLTVVRKAGHPFAIGDSVVMKAGQRMETYDLDLSGWQGRIADIGEDGLFWIMWDSHTLEAIPERAVERWIAEAVDWTGMIVPPEAVDAIGPRDEAADGLDVARRRLEAYGFDIEEFLSESSLEFWGFFDPDLGMYFNEMDYPLFELDRFLADLEIPKSEHKNFERCLTAGLKDYYLDIYGYHKYGRQPFFLIDERMGEPYIFGYGALKILENKRISKTSKLKVCRYVLDFMSPGNENGLPHGLVSVLGYMAKENELAEPDFLKGMMALEFGSIELFRRPDWMIGVSKEALIALTDWISLAKALPEDQMLWWIWKWSMHCDNQPHLGKVLANHWLQKPEVPAGLKKELCWAWLLDEREVGSPPVEWLLMEAYMSGDEAKIEQVVQDLGIDPEQVPLPDFEELPDQQRDDMLDFLFNPSNSPYYYWLTPAYLKRLAIPALVRLGEELDDLVELFWDTDRDYYADALNSGIADALEEFHDRVPPDEFRQWIERGISYSKAGTRKRFYLLSTQFYGTEYLERALQDNAKSIRTWAGKKMKKASVQG